MTELMSSGIELMLIGMGIVFLFLAMLVVAINIMSSLVQRFFPEPPATTMPVVISDVSKSTVAAISVAVHEYRSTHK